MIPEMWPFLVVAKPFAPLTPEIAEKKPTPGESILNARSMLYLKSLALTGLPSEYFRFGRSVNFRSLPSAETFGSSPPSTASAARRPDCDVVVAEQAAPHVVVELERRDGV